MPNFAHDAARLDQINATLKALQDEANDIKARYADVPSDKYDAGDYIMTVSRNRLFDPAAAKRILTKAQYAQILVAKPDGAVAKRVFADKYERMTKESAVILKVTPVTDEDDE